MKKYFLMISCLAVTATACAQSQVNLDDMFPNGITYKTADGRIVPKDKIDSVKKAYGGQLSYVHKSDQPGVLYLIARNSETERAESESKKKLAGMIGQAAPEFSTGDIFGRNYTLSGLKGKIVVLNFWFTNCGGCIAEIPELNRIKSNYDSKAVFISFALDKAHQVSEFQKKHPFKYALIANARAIHQAYDIYACPISMVIDRSGKISWVSEFSAQISETLPRAIDALQ